MHACVLQAPGKWVVNGASSLEIEEFSNAFKSLPAVVKFANYALARGDLAGGRKSYVEALTLFTVLENDKGMGIVNNNLGIVHTLQARELVIAAKAARENDPLQAENLMTEAQECFAYAATNFKLAIQDADLLYAAAKTQPDGDSLHGGEVKAEEIVDEGGNAPADVNADGGDDNTSEKALRRQLAVRKFNFALCLAAKGKSPISAGGGSDSNAINQARELLEECIQLTSPDGGGDGTNFNRDAKNDVRRFGYLLELASLERGEQGRSEDAGEALDAAARVLAPYTSVDANGGRLAELAAATAPTLDIPVPILQQRLLGARAAHCEAFGDPQVAVGHYTQALIGTGDIMDPDVARSSLKGLHRMVSRGNNYGRFFSSELLLALHLPPNDVEKPESVRSAIDDALAKVEKAEKSVRSAQPPGSANMTTVDLCFVMDCTGSVRTLDFDVGSHPLPEVLESTDKGEVLRYTAQTKDSAACSLSCVSALHEAKFAGVRREMRCSVLR